MGTEKRDRQRANRAARIEEAETARQAAARKARLVTIGLILVVLVAVVVAILAFGGTEDDDVVAGAGEACKAVQGDIPEGTPAFEIPEGPPSGSLDITDITPGEGDPVPEGATVTVDYLGVACSTGVIFDESFSSGGTGVTFPLSGVIEGWTKGIPGMRVGGERLLVIPGNMGYGEEGAGEDIGPNETLIFVVRLISFEGGTTATSAATSPVVTPDPAPAGASITGETPCPAADGTAERTTSFEQVPPNCLEEGASYAAVFDTSAGTVRVDLDAEGMPSTTNNFVVLARYGFYDGTALFRTDPSIDIIQGGAATTNSASDPGPGYTIPDEGGEFTWDEETGQGTGPFTYAPGQLIMARSAGPDSSGAQFFFSTGPNVSNLDSQGTYLLFGEVTEGLDVLQAIIASHVADPTSGLGGGPMPGVTINKVTIEQS